MEYLIVNRTVPAKNRIIVTGQNAGTPKTAGNKKPNEKNRSIPARPMSNVD